MKILFVGQCSMGQTARMRMECLARLGYSITSLDSEEILCEESTATRWMSRLSGISHVINRLNEAVLKCAFKEKPELLWCDKQDFITQKTLRQLQRKGIKTLHYTPDPYFFPLWRRTTIMNSSLPLYDWVVTSKQYEMGCYRQTAKKVIYSPLGFDEFVHRPLLPWEKSQADHFMSDVCFVGGWEPRRESFLAAIPNDINLKIWGDGWEHLVSGEASFRRMVKCSLLAGRPYFKIKKKALGLKFQTASILGDQYAWAISASKISIGFLRTTWPDQHTTRTFEIPACATFLLADRTEEHRDFFEEGKEAEFFSSREEMLDKISFYLKHDAARKEIARAGYLRCYKSRYSYIHRMKEILDAIK